jgi:hypothetical protein
MTLLSHIIGVELKFRRRKATVFESICRKARRGNE